MSRSDADIFRREQGIIIKRPVGKAEFTDDYYDNVPPPEGCQYYGNVSLMKYWCLHCKDKDHCW